MKRDVAQDQNHPNSAIAYNHDMNTEQHASITRTAFFRFYEELNDFLSEEQYKTFFPYEFMDIHPLKTLLKRLGCHTLK